MWLDLPFLYNNNNHNNKYIERQSWQNIPQEGSQTSFNTDPSAESQFWRCIIYIYRLYNGNICNIYDKLEILLRILKNSGMEMLTMIHLEIRKWESKIHGVTHQKWLINNW